MSRTKDLRTIQPEDLLRYRFLQDGQLSPDGKALAYTASHVDAEADEEYGTVWLLSLNTRKSQPLTSELAQDTNPQWSPDGEQIALLSDHGGSAQIYLISVKGGEARPLTRMPQGVGDGPVWSPDGT